MTSCWLSKVETKRELKVEQMVEFRTAKVSTSARKFLELWSMRNSWTFIGTLQNKYTEFTFCCFLCFHFFTIGSAHVCLYFQKP